MDQEFWVGLWRVCISMGVLGMYFILLRCEKMLKGFLADRQREEEGW